MQVSPKLLSAFPDEQITMGRQLWVANLTATGHAPDWTI